jgi:hypothetical protein
MATDLTVSDGAKRKETRYGVGFVLTVGERTLTLEPRALWSDEELRQGNIEVVLPEDDERNIGKFVEFWKAFNDNVVDLPPVEWQRLPEPLNSLAEADVILRRFELKLVDGNLAKLLLDVTVETEWKVSFFKNVTVNSVSVVIDVNRRGGVVVKQAPKPLPAGGATPS